MRVPTLSTDIGHFAVDVAPCATCGKQCSYLLGPSVRVKTVVQRESADAAAAVLVVACRSKPVKGHTDTMPIRC
eukprot:4263225-Amphidinium_carterae.2